MHHACYDGGAGWCMFSDLTLALRQLRKASQGAVKQVMIIDTDVHQVSPSEMLLHQRAPLNPCPRLTANILLVLPISTHALSGLW